MKVCYSDSSLLFLRVILLFFLSFHEQGVVIATTEPSNNIISSKPNILFIISDDLRSDIGPYREASKIITPNIQKFAEQALTFENTYCQMATCGPSRNSFLSGRRNDNLRSWNFLDDLRSRSRKVISLPQLYKIEGYDTVSIGKFFHAYNFRDIDVRSWTQIYLPPGKKEIRCPGKSNAVSSFYCSCSKDGLPCIDENIAETAIDFLKSPERQKRPFFLGIGFRRPHLDYIAPPDNVFNALQSYSGNNPPSNLLLTNFNQTNGMPNIAWSYCDTGRAQFQNKTYFFPWAQYPPNLIRDFRRQYWRTVSYMDVQFGRVLDTLNSIPSLASNTIIVFTGDNGFALGEKAHLCKNGLMDVHDRVPLIMKLPESKDVYGGAWKGQKVSSIVELLDIYRTVVSMTKSDLPKCNVEGRDLTKFFANPTSTSFFPDLTEDSTISADMSIKYSFALSQIPRCDIKYGNASPCTWTSSKAFTAMGYSVKTKNWKYIEWRKWKKTKPDWSSSGFLANELYSQLTDASVAPQLNFELYENENVAYKYPDIVSKLAKILQSLVDNTRNMYPNACKPKY